jgi:hypothetical protein
MTSSQDNQAAQPGPGNCYHLVLISFPGRAIAGLQRRRRTTRISIPAIKLSSEKNSGVI